MNCIGGRFYKKNNNNNNFNDSNETNMYIVDLFQTFHTPEREIKHSIYE